MSCTVHKLMKRQVNLLQENTFLSVLSALYLSAIISVNAHALPEIKSKTSHTILKILRNKPINTHTHIHNLSLFFSLSLFLYLSLPLSVMSILKTYRERDIAQR